MSQNYDSHLIFQQLGKYSFEAPKSTKSTRKIYELYLEKVIDPSHPRVFTDRVHFK